jgi:hypothetical protein
MDGMNRRAFLQVTTGGAAAAVLPPLVALPTATGVPVLFDERFPAARAHAEKLAGTEQSLQAVAGDATDLMQGFAAGRGPRRLIGVTAESVPFCLSELAPRDKRPRLTLRRLDQDLFAGIWCTRHDTPDASPRPHRKGLQRRAGGVPPHRR